MKPNANFERKKYVLILVNNFVFLSPQVTKNPCYYKAAFCFPRQVIVKGSFQEQYSVPCKGIIGPIGPWALSPWTHGLMAHGPMGHWVPRPNPA